MKVTELKKILADADNELLKKSIVEVYKLLPTSKKDEADCAIMNILGCETGKKKAVLAKQSLISYVMRLIDFYLMHMLVITLFQIELFLKRKGLNGVFL